MRKWFLSIFIYALPQLEADRKYLLPKDDTCDSEEWHELSSGEIVAQALDLVMFSKDLITVREEGDCYLPGTVVQGGFSKYSLIKQVDPFALSLRYDTPLYSSASSIYHDLLLGQPPGSSLEKYTGKSIGVPNKGFEKYGLKRKFGLGGQGEVWQAVEIGNEKQVFILKRVFADKGEHYRLSGYREAHFGNRLQGRESIARFVECFNHTIIKSDGTMFEDLWLVFKDEGQSLDALLYAQVERSERLVTLEPSPLWHRMRGNSKGSLVRREILKQILEGMKVLEEMKVAHRDIKPSNILIKESDKKNQATSRSFQVKIADFGSAVDTEDGVLNTELYGATGATELEETHWYRPPEAMLASVESIRFPYMGDDRSGMEKLNRELPMHAFDMWSLGVVALEMLAGTSRIFEVDSRARARIDQRTNRESHLYSNEDEKTKLLEFRYFIKALEHFGIGPGMKCNRQLFNQTIRKIDPFKTGTYFNDASLFLNHNEMMLFGDTELDFLSSLLSWSPFKRPTPTQALDHPYFAL